MLLENLPQPSLLTRESAQGAGPSGDDFKAQGGEGKDSTLP